MSFIWLFPYSNADVLLARDSLSQDLNATTRSAIYRERDRQASKHAFTLHPKDAELSITGLNLVPAAHGCAEPQTKVPPRVLWGDYAVILSRAELAKRLLKRDKRRTC